MSDQFLYLTTIGRATGLPREIEIWFVPLEERLYILAERGRRAQWVKNIERDSRVWVRVGSREGRRFAARARVLDKGRDVRVWQAAQRLSREKYGWGEGLPVEITPDEADANDPGDSERTATRPGRDRRQRAPNRE